MVFKQVLQIGTGRAAPRSLIQVQGAVRCSHVRVPRWMGRVVIGAHRWQRRGAGRVSRWRTHTGMGVGFSGWCGGARGSVEARGEVA